MKKTGTKLTRPIRRDERVTAYISVLVFGETPEGRIFEEHTKTLSVNAYGALITLNSPVTMGQTLRMRNPATHQEKECRVVYNESSPAGRSEVAVEFLKPAVGFWKLDGKK